MKIIHDKKKCIGCGTCASLCPEYFEMKNGKAHLKGSEEDSETGKEVLQIEKATDNLKQAVNACPVKSIELKQEE